MLSPQDWLYVVFSPCQLVLSIKYRAFEDNHNSNEKVPQNLLSPKVGWSIDRVFGTNMAGLGNPSSTLSPFFVKILRNKGEQKRGN